tara:strand:+ start:1395 stop:1760 length:366 start_codon:yes stop_codon:yes gene_type:complete
MSTTKQQIDFIELMVTNTNNRIDKMLDLNDFIQPGRSKGKEKLVKKTAMVKFKTLDRALISDVSSALASAIKEELEERELTVRDIEESVDVFVIGSEDDNYSEDGEGVSMMVQCKLTCHEK